MKKVMMLLVAMCLMFTMSASAHDDKDKKDKGKAVSVTGIVTDPMCAKSGKKEKMMDADCTKRCAEKGGLALVNDEDGKVWTIDNADAVKGHEGHRVKVSGHPNAEKGTIHIETVAMVADQSGVEKHKDGMKHDEMKHDEKKN